MFQFDERTIRTEIGVVDILVIHDDTHDLYRRSHYIKFNAHKKTIRRAHTHLHRVQLNSNPQQNSSNDRPTKHGVINSKFVFFIIAKYSIVAVRCGLVWVWL